MKGDFTRTTFRRDRHYSGVRLQQGRVQLDADFNEQVDIDAHRDRETTRDVVGPSGVPDLGGGFEVFATVRLAAIDAAGGVLRAVGQRGTILASADAGASWTAQSSPTQVDLHSVDVVDGNLAYAAGDGPTILKTTNGGGSWSAQSLPAAAAGAIRGISFADAQRGCAVGDGGLILATTNGGSSWSVKPVAGVAETLRAVNFVSATHAWAVGDRGRIVATTDGGSSWQVQQAAPGFENTLRGVHFVGQATGWAVGDGATIVSTTNGGGAWTVRSAPLGLTAPLRSLAAESAQVVWAVGDGPTVLRSANGGAGWQSVSSPGFDLTGVRVGGGSVVVCGELATLARATAGPSPAWTPAKLPEPLPAADLGITAGRIYVDGKLCEAERPARFLAQPDLPGAAFPVDAGVYAAYLDVWERHLTGLERGDIREVALGGPDTATRTQTVWQLRLAKVPDTTTCAALGPGWTPPAPPAPSSGRLRARGKPAPVAADECMVPAEGGYRRLENQLYRVEVIKPGAGGGGAGAASFIWSRDNGTMAARLIGVDDLGSGMSRLIVSDPGRDSVIGFKGAKYVELSDEERSLRGQPAGRVFEVESVNEGQITIKHTPSDAGALAEFAAGAIVRRWDGYGTVEANGWLALEGGVEVQFTPGQYTAGDYWTIPARTTTAGLEWPSDGGEPRFEPRHGIDHRYCALALVRRENDGTWRLVSDCRPLFTSLTEQTRMTMAGGDGQELAPGTPQGLLPYPIEVAVMNGRRPLGGARVRFRVEEGQGSLTALGDGGGSAATAVDAVTNANGIAACEWRLNASKPRHRVIAQLLDRGGEPLDAPAHFNARVAAPGGGGVCTVDVRPGDDLQQAVEQLQELGGELCLAAGEYQLDQPLQLDGLRRVVIEGRGPATVLRCEITPVIDATRCEEVWIRSLRVEGGAKQIFEDRARGAITLYGCRGAKVLDCEVAVADGQQDQAACIAIEDADAEETSTTIERNRLEVGVNRVGVLISESGSVRVQGNRITLIGDPDELSRGFVREGIRALGDRMRTALVRRELDEPERIVALDESDLTLRVDDRAELGAVWNAVVETDRAGVFEASDARSMIEEFVSLLEEDMRVDRRFGSRSHANIFSRVGDEPLEIARIERERAVVEFVRLLRSGFAGVFATGETLGPVDVSGNEIDGCVVGIGIHSGEKEPSTRIRFAVDANTIECQGERAFDQRPTAVALRNPGAASVTGTHATLRGDWSISPDAARANKDIHAIRAEGMLGPYLVIRHSSMRGFPTGVSIEPSNDRDDIHPDERDWLWLVAETLADRAFLAVSAPPSVEQERNRGRFV